MFLQNFLIRSALLYAKRIDCTESDVRNSSRNQSDSFSFESLTDGALSLEMVRSFRSNFLSDINQEEQFGLKSIFEDSKSSSRGALCDGKRKELQIKVR
jgi:hypothetical protein